MQRIREFFNNVSDYIKEIFKLVFITMFGGVVIGLSIWLGIMFAYYGMFWVLGVTVFFSIFHLDDLREFVKKRNIVGFIGRLICLYGMGSFICGYIAYASGGYSIKANLFADYAMIFSFGFAFITIPLVYIVITFLRYSPVFFFFENIVNKLYEVGILWRY